METTARSCKCCGKPINLSIGRKDRQFCNEVCKNRFHNTLSYEEEKEIKRIQLILKKNRRILKKAFQRSDHNELARDLLLKHGFDFDFHTHFKTTVHYHYQYTFCFDYGYRLLTSGRYKIVKAFEVKEE